MAEDTHVLRGALHVQRYPQPSNTVAPFVQERQSSGAYPVPGDALPFAYEFAYDWSDRVLPKHNEGSNLAPIHYYRMSIIGRDSPRMSGYGPSITSNSPYGKLRFGQSEGDNYGGS